MADTGERHRSKEPRSKKPKVAFSPPELEEVRRSAKAAKVAFQAYVREAALEKARGTAKDAGRPLIDSPTADAAHSDRDFRRQAILALLDLLKSS